MNGNLAPPEQFDNLGLSLSGGGVRAVGFHLGTLDVLERLGLLEKVSILSTVSGGSLVGIGYALFLKTRDQAQPPRSFGDFYNDYFNFLPQLNTMEELVKGLNEPSPSGRRTVVGAMARIYRDHYFEPVYGDPKFGIFWDAQPEIHLKDMIFNATDFKTGLAFRFQRNMQNQDRIGNEQVFLEESHAQELYMADIMTTSSCLPALLEPMIMPEDYRLPDAVKADIDTHFKTNCYVELDYVALMDGGMLDNQGVSGILLSLLRNRQDPGLPLPPPVLPAMSAFDYGLQWRSRVRASEAITDQPMNVSVKQVSETEDPSPLSAPLSGEATTEVDPLSLFNLAIQDLDLLIVSDTPVYKEPEDRYFPKKHLFNVFTGIKNRLMSFSLIFYVLVWLLIFIAGVVSLALVIWGLISVWMAALPGTGFFKAILDAIAASTFPGPLKIGLVAMVFVAIPVMLIHLGSWALTWILARKAEDQMDALIPRRGNVDRKSLWHYIKRLKVKEFWLLIKLRLLSVMRLASSIFMNRVRQLSYRWLLEMEELESRFIPNEIFKLRVLNASAGAGSMTPRGPHPLPGWLSATTPQIDTIVEKSSRMKTQIYLDHRDVPGERAEDNLEMLAACGNLTTCFNILEYLWQVHGNGDLSNNGDDAFPAKPHAEALFIATRTLWDQLQVDPYFYVNDRRT